MVLSAASVGAKMVGSQSIRQPWSVSVAVAVVAYCHCFGSPSGSSVPSCVVEKRHVASRVTVPPSSEVSSTVKSGVAVTVPPAPSPSYKPVSAAAAAASAFPPLTPSTNCWAVVRGSGGPSSEQPASTSAVTATRADTVLFEVSTGRSCLERGGYYIYGVIM